MITKVLSTIDGVTLYPIISLMIFIPFFIAVTIWVFKLDKQYLHDMGEMPLIDSTDSVEERN